MGVCECQRRFRKDKNQWKIFPSKKQKFTVMFPGEARNRRKIQFLAMNLDRMMNILERGFWDRKRVEWEKEGGYKLKMDEYGWIWVEKKTIERITEKMSNLLFFYHYRIIEIKK